MKQRACPPSHQAPRRETTNEITIREYDIYFILKYPEPPRKRPKKEHFVASNPSWVDHKVLLGTTTQRRKDIWIFFVWKKYKY